MDEAPPAGAAPGVASTSEDRKKTVPPWVATLQNAVINLQALREHSREEIVKVVDSMRGKKVLVLDPKLSGPLGLVAEFPLLRDHGVERIFRLSADPLNVDTKNILYLVRPRMDLMKMISDQIHAHEERQMGKEYSIFFVPRRTMICERVLEEEGVYGEVSLGEYHLDLIPFDEDILSLELEGSFRECFLDGDHTSLHYMARALMKLQSMFGIIPNIKGKGNCSRLVCDMILRMRKEMGTPDPTTVPEIETLIILDRDVDLVTPMLTQLTYEGLIDEVFRIQNTNVEIDPAVLNKEGGTKKHKEPLNSNSKLFAEIRDLNFSVLGPLLHKRANYVQDNYKLRHEAQTIPQIHDFMKMFGSLQQEHKQLHIHISLAERIQAVTRTNLFHRRLEAEQGLIGGSDDGVEFIEECINRQEPLVKVLRLLCLYSLTHNGVKPKSFDFFRREILQTYGYEWIFTLNNLEKLGLFKRSEGKNHWNLFKKSLRLLVEDIDENNPTDCSYVYSGYAPLSVRLIQHVVKTGSWRGLDDVLKLLPGPHFDETQSVATPASVAEGEQQPRSKVVLVLFVGGVTYTELSALRFIGKNEDGQRDFVVATSRLVNGTTLLESVMEPIENGLTTAFGGPAERVPGK